MDSDNKILILHDFGLQNYYISFNFQNEGFEMKDDPTASKRKHSEPGHGKGAEIKVDLDLMKKIPLGAQTTSVLVGQV